MIRRSERLHNGRDNTRKHERAASGSSTSLATQKKLKKGHVTPTASQYFGSNASDLDAGPEDGGPSSEDDVEESSSEFGDDAEEDMRSEVEESDEDAPESEDDTPRRRAGSGRTIAKTGLGPGKQIIIKKPKARSAGAVPYADHTIHPNTLLFLADLEKNNKREWLKMYDAEFRQAEKDFHSFVQDTTEKLIAIDDTIPELPVKDVIFRIYRDVRFSRDPTPYKPFFSAAWSRTGRKSTYASYYIQLAPNGKSFVGGGLWHPEAGPTNAMRMAIDRNPRGLKEVLLDADVRKEFLDGASRSEKAAVQAFVTSNSGNALKTKPKGYDADHPDLDLLRLRNFTVGKKLADNEVLGDSGMERILQLLAYMKPFITYLNSVVLPDQDDESESDEDSADEAGEDA